MTTGTNDQHKDEIFQVGTLVAASIQGPAAETLATNAIVGAAAANVNADGGNASVTGAAGGATSGDGGDAVVTGGAATNGNGNGGSVVLTGGAKNGTGVAGGIRAESIFIKKISAPAAMTVTAVIAAADIVGGLITANQGAAGAATYTTCTGTQLQAALPADFAVGDSIDFSIINISTVAAEDVTVAGGVDMTAVGNMTIASNAAVSDQAWGTFRVRKTGDHAFSFYRIG